mgnify:CR=1 FL=1
MKDTLKYIIAMLIYGTNGIVAAYIDLPSEEIVLMRTVAGGSLLMLLSLVTRARPEPGAVRSQGLKLLGAGVCLGANWALLFEAYNIAGVSMATLMDYCAPVIVLLLSPLLLRQKQGARAYIGMAAAVFGLVLALGIGGVHITGTALAVGLAAAVFYAGLIILNQMIKGFSGLQLTAAELVIAAVVMLCYVLLRGGSIRLPGNEGGTAALLVLCTVNTALACYLYFSSMNRLRARTVALLGYIDPVSALVFAAVFLNESMTALQIFGAALVLAGAAYGQSGGKERL